MAIFNSSVRHYQRVPSMVNSDGFLFATVYLGAEEQRIPAAAQEFQRPSNFNTLQYHTHTRLDITHCYTSKIFKAQHDHSCCWMFVEFLCRII